MGLFNRMKEFINPDTDADYEGYPGDDYPGEDYPGGYDDPDIPQNNGAQNGGGYAQPQYKSQASSGMGLNSSALEMKVVKPEKYDSTTAQKIADHLVNGRTVVLNLESTNKESARRLIDFLSGVAYSISGYIQRVANSTFVIVPKNVDVSGEQLQEAKRQEENDLF